MNSFFATEKLVTEWNLLSEGIPVLTDLHDDTRKINSF